MKFKRNAILVLGSISIPFLSSCSINSQINVQQKFQYNQFINRPNEIGSFSFHPSGIDEYVTTQHHSLGSAFLFNYHYQRPIQFDYTNNRVELPSIKHLTFNLATNLLLIFEDGSQILYDKDVAEITPQPNLGRGYKENLIIAYSNDKHSINHLDFFDNLNKAKRIEISLGNNQYVDHNNNITSYSLVAKDFYFSLMQNKLRNKTNDNLLIKFKKYGLEIEKLLRVTNYEVANKLVFENSNKWNFALFFEQELNKNLIFSPLSSQYIETNHKANDFGLSWYQQKLENALFLSNYIMVHNSFEAQKWVLSKAKISNHNQLTQINFKYSLVPLNSAQYQTKIFNDFQNGLIANLDLNQLNTQRRQQILENAANFKINYTAIQKQNTNIIKSFVNWFPNSQNNFNNNYKLVFYGDDKTKRLQHLFDENVFELRNNLSNYLNNFAFSFLTKKGSYWNSYANPDILLNGSDANGTNYQNLLDAYVPINRFNFLFEGKIASETILDQEKYFFNLNQGNDLLINQFNTKIQNNVQRLLNYFYQKYNLKGTLDWKIPIYQQNLNTDEFLALNSALKVFKKLDPRLNPTLFIVHDNNSLQQLKDSDKYTSNFNIISNNINHFDSYLMALFSNNQNSLWAPLLFWSAKSNFLTNYQNFRTKFFEFLKVNNINNDKLITIKNQKLLSEEISKLHPNIMEIISSFIKQYQTEHTNFELISLINEIDTVYTKPLSIETFSQQNNLNQELIQTRFLKPYFENNIINFSNIIVKEPKDV